MPGEAYDKHTDCVTAQPDCAVTVIVYLSDGLAGGEDTFVVSMVADCDTNHGRSQHYYGRLQHYYGRSQHYCGRLQHYCGRLRHYCGRLQHYRVAFGRVAAWGIACKVLKYSQARRKDC